MKQRVISALVGLVILFVVLVFFGFYVFNLVMAVISVIAVLELLKATKTVQFRDLAAIAVIFAVLLPFANEATFWSLLPQIVFVLFAAFFLLLLRHHGRLPFEKASMVLVISIFVPLCFSCAVFMRNQHGVTAGRYYLLIALAAAWLCDSGAYFVGVLFGKHKLAPIISPKKTIEGSVGGVILTIVLIMPLAFTYGQIAAALGTPVRIDYLRLALITPFLSVMGMFGDLSMSVIKRQFDIKDYGSIMPGHGGVLDRFDSVLFTLPSVYIITQYVPTIVLLG